MAKDLYTKLVINAQDNTSGALGKTRAGVQSISEQLEKLQTRLVQFAGLKIADIIGNQLGNLIKTADGYKTLESRLKLVSDSTGEYNTAQKETFNIAQRTRSDLAATATVYGKVETAIKQLGGTQKDALGITETLNQAIALTSQGAGQDAAAILQFSQALGSGVLRGDEFNSVMENAPGLMQALADGLGTPITKLREMAEAGELTADKLVNALGKSAPKVAEQFKQLPLTVGGAVTQLTNVVTLYIGQTDKATGASGKLAAGIQALAKNFDSVVDVGILIAELFGARLVLAMSKSAQATLQAAFAAKAKAAADLQARQNAQALLQDEIKLAAIKVKSAKLAVDEARLQAALSVTEKQRAQGLKQLAAAYTALHAAIDKSNAKQAALNATLTNGPAVLNKTDKAINLLNGAFSAFLAFDVGQSVGEWLNQFELVRQAGSYLAETMAVATTGVQGLINGVNFSDRIQQIQQIHAEFEQIRAGLTDGAQRETQAVQQAEANKTQAIEQAALKQAESFKNVQEAAKALTASLDADAKTQSAAITQALTERLAAIDALNTGEAEKATLRTQAQIAAAGEEIKLQQSTATAKLEIINREYEKEITAAAANKDRANQLETEKRQAKLAVYTGLAEYYQNEINRLSGVYANEVQLAAQTKQQIQQLNQSHEQILFNISLQGMTERQKLDAEQARFDDLTRKARQLREKDAIGNQEEINRLLTEAGTLNQTITAAAGNKADALSKATDNEKLIYAEQKKELEAVAQSHEDNAARAKAAQDDVAAKLQETRDTVKSIADQLNQDYTLKITTDPVSVKTMRDLIAELTAPSEKVITIKTVMDGKTTGSSGGTTGSFFNGGLPGEPAGLTVPKINIPNPTIPNIPPPKPVGGDTGPSVSVNLSLNGEQAGGQFPDTPQTQALLNELKKAGAVAL